MSYTLQLLKYSYRKAKILTSKGSAYLLTVINAIVKPIKLLLPKMELNSLLMDQRNFFKLLGMIAFTPFIVELVLFHDINVNFQIFQKF